MNMKRVAVYCRVSTDNENQIHSLENQRMYFHEYISRQPGWLLQEVYADEGISGTTTKKRIQFNRMLQAAREGLLDLIITKEVSRFARNVLDTISYTRELKALGVGVLFLNDAINTMEPDAELRLSIMGSIAQEESRKTSSRVKWGQQRRMEQGVVFGSSLLGYRVERGELSIVPEEAAIVQKIFYKYCEERKGAPTIAKELRETGIQSSRGNCLWSASTVLKILKNEKYCGDLIQKKTYTPDYLSHAKKYNKGEERLIILRNHHEPIIPRELFDAAQAEMRRRCTQGKGGGHGNRYPLSGKIKCGNCQSSFVARTRKGKEGGTYKIWRCAKTVIEGREQLDGAGQKMGCNIGHQIREDMAMDIVKSTVQMTVQDKSKTIMQDLIQIVEENLRMYKDYTIREHKRLEQELKRLQVKKAAALNAILSDALSTQDFTFLNARIDQEIENVQGRLTTNEKNAALYEREDRRELLETEIYSMVFMETIAPEICSKLLDHMKIFDDGRIEVFLKSMTAKWTYVFVNTHLQ